MMFDTIPEPESLYDGRLPGFRHDFTQAPLEDYPQQPEHEDYSDIRLRDLTRAGFGGSFPPDKRFRILFTWSVSSFLVGLVLVFFAWMWVAVLFDPGFDGIIHATVVVDSNTSLGYADFMLSPGESRDIPPFYELWWFLNVTNSEDVRTKGHHPIVTNHGPYVYSMIKTKLNVSFTDDGNVVNYRECQSWIWQPELSLEYGCVDCDPDRDIIINVNPGYMGAIAQAGGELPLVQAFTGPSMAKIFAFMMTTFVPDMVALQATIALPAQQAFIQQNQSLTADAFFAVWANATTPPISNPPVWSGMLVSLDLAQPSNISLASATLLFDANTAYSLTNEQASAYQLWTSVAVHGNQSAAAFAAETFAMSVGQVELVATWLRMQFWPQWVNPVMEQRFGVPSIDLLAYVQWGEGTVSPVVTKNKKSVHQSIQELYPDKEFGAKPEFALWDNNGEAGKMTWQNSLLLWGDLTNPRAGNQLGLFNAQNWAVFALYATNMTALEEVWGIDDQTQLALLGVYFMDMADKFAQPDMAYLASIGGGVFTSRTVNTWAWRAIDPLLLFLQPESADVALQPNITSEEDCLASATTRIDAFYTGKDNVKQVGGTITFAGMHEFPADWYNTSYPPYQVHGVNAEGQFQPFIKAKQPLFAFDNNFMRTLRLDHIANVTVKGVRSFRYTISLENFAAPNYPFSVNNPELQGFCNVTGPEQGAPVFLSQAYMYGAKNKYVDKVIGMPVPNPDVDPTFVDIEPYTGKAIQTSQALQVNLHNPCQPNWFLLSPFGNENMACEIMFPIAVIRQYSILDEYNVHQIVGELYLGLRLKKVIYACFLGIGFGALALCAFLGWLSLRRLRSVNRSSLGSDQTQRLIGGEDDE